MDDADGLNVTFPANSTYPANGSQIQIETSASWPNCISQPSFFTFGVQGLGAVTIMESNGYFTLNSDPNPAINAAINGVGSDCSIVFTLQ